MIATRCLGRLLWPSMRREIPSLEYRVSHSTQAARYTYTIYTMHTYTLCEEAEGDLYCM